MASGIISFVKLLSLTTLLFNAIVIALDPSDTWRDADLGQSSYVGGNHNMDPNVVNSSSFGLLWKKGFNSQEQFYAKPLVYTSLANPNQQIVFIASSQNWVRTLDAKTGALINSRQLWTPFLQSDIGCTDIPNTIGITGTPTIDYTTDTVYLFSKTYIAKFRDTTSNTGTYNGVYYFHSLDINTLQDKNPPLLVDGSVSQNDARRYFVGGVVLQRPSLTQIGNVVYAGFGGHCDLFNYTGLIIGVDVTKNQIVYNFATESGPQAPFTSSWSTESGGLGGVWQSGDGLATDGNRLFFVTGNGQGHMNNGVPASGTSGCTTLGEAVVNLQTGGTQLTVNDYFQPYDYQNMDGGDRDFGSGGIALLDPTVFKGTNVNKMAVTAGKNGKIYILNADNLGGYMQGPGNTDRVIQSITTNEALFGGPGSYPLEGGYIYFTPVGYPTYAYKLGFDSSGNPSFNLVGQTNEISAGRVGVGIPTVTSYKGQAGTGIVWMTDPNAGIRAWSAVPNNGILQPLNMPQINGANKFQRPSFGNTRLYTTDSTGVLYCLGSPVNLPLNCTNLDFGQLALGGIANGNVTCTANIPITQVSGMTVGDSHFQVSNSSLPAGKLTAGQSFSIPVTWNLTAVKVSDSANASFGTVTPGIVSTPLTIFTVNGVAGYTVSLPISLSGTEVSQAPFLSISPPTIAFAAITLGVAGESTTTTATFSMANIGNSTMTILGYAYTYNDTSDPAAVWYNATQYPNGTWDLGTGIYSSDLPAVGTNFTAGYSQVVDTSFTPILGTGAYMSYLMAYTNGGNKFVTLEGSASTAPVANMSFSNGEGGWNDVTNSLNPEYDFGPVLAGNSSATQLRICNAGGSTLEITKSKPPSGVLRAEYPGSELSEGQTIQPGDCAYAHVVFNPNAEPVDAAEFFISNTWTLNTDDLNFGVHFVNFTGIVRSRQVGPLYASNGTSEFLYMGCYLDGAPRLLPNNIKTGTMDNSICQTACKNAGYTFAGTEYQSQCWCGNNPPPGYKYYPESAGYCSYACTNDATQACGGNGGYISVFYDQAKFAPNNQTYNTTQPPPPTTVKQVGAYQWQGCWKEGTGGRALSGKAVAAPAAGMTVEYCMSACSAYTYFGVEYTNECYCGNIVNTGATYISGSDPGTGCSMICGGNPSEYCGGASKLDLYQLNTTIQTASSSSIALSTTSSSLSSSSMALSTISSTSSSSVFSTITISSSLSTNSSSSVPTLSILSTSLNSNVSTSSSLFISSSTAIFTSTSLSISSSSSLSTSSSLSISPDSTVSSSSFLSTSSNSSVSTSSSSSASVSSSISTSSSLSISLSSSISTSSSSSISSSSSVASSSASLSSSTSTSSPSATPTLLCPQNNATTYTTVNGTWVIECYVDHAGGDISGDGAVTLNLVNCINICSTIPNCVDVSWLSGPKNCYYKSKLGAAKSNTAVWGARKISGPGISSTSSSVAPSST